MMQTSLLYLIGILGIVFFLRAVYLKKGRRTLIFYLLFFVFNGLGFASMYFFKNITLVMVLIALSIIFLIMGAVGRDSNK